MAHKDGIRMHHDRPIRQLERLVEPRRKNAVDERRAHQAGAVVRPYLHSASGELGGLVDATRPALVPPLNRASVDTVSQDAQSLGILGVSLEGQAQQRLGALVLGVGLPEPRRQCAQVEVVGAQALGGLGTGASDLCVPHVIFHRGDDPGRDLILQGEDVPQIPIKAVGPEVGAGLGLDQLGGDAHTVGGLAHAALDKVANAELAADLLHIGKPALVDEARLPGDHEQPAHARQRRQNVIDHAVREVLLFGISAHVGEGQDRDGRTIRNRRLRLCARVDFNGPRRRGRHRGHETIAAPGHGGDRLRSQVLAQHRDLHLQVGLLNDKPRPHEVEEFVLRHHAVAMLDQGHEEVKGARTQWHRQSVDPRFSRRRNDFYPAKPVGATFRIAHAASILATDDRRPKPAMLVWGILWTVRNRRHGRAST